MSLPKKIIDKINLDADNWVKKVNKVLKEEWDEFELYLLKCHLLMEYELNTYLELRTRNRVPIEKSGFTFSTKVRIAKMLGCFEDDEQFSLFEQFLGKLNTIRNQIGEDPGHSVLVGVGRWICYYLVDHPNKGRCHYFHIKPDITGELPDKPQLEYIVKEFGIESPLLDECIMINREDMVVNIVLPLAS